MDIYPWWTEAQIKLAEDAKKFTDEVLMPIGMRSTLTNTFSWEAIKLMADEGWFGALVPKEYGGHFEEWGVTGAAILNEEAARAGMAGPLGTTMFGSATQLLHNGNDAQKEKWLRPMAKGELLGCIVMTEPYAGSDIASIESTAVCDGDDYIINGKKRFQTTIAAADLYLCYFQTSNKPEDRAAYRHLSAFVVEKGSPGFHVEKINDLYGMRGNYNGNLTFDDARIPVFNRLGEEGEGWKIMMGGLNVERILNAAPIVGSMRECIRYAQQHLKRRLQFGRPTGDITTNQFKLSDMISKLYLSRLVMYYASYCADLGRKVPVEAAVSKLYASDSLMEMAIEAIQCMGGHGVLRIYPLERIMQGAKLSQIAAGTSEVLKLLIYRQGTRRMKEDLKVPQRIVDPELKVPLPVGHATTKTKAESELDVLAIMAENYRVNPGLHMTMDDIKEWLDIEDVVLVEYLESLEAKGYAGLYRTRRGIELARITLSGIQVAHPPEYYNHIPEWVEPQDMF
ncbi:MAG: acyl-CoA/acyl-ACP dehydrogenase [Deltaproteobacteria bacterium]|nr:acyl-CoA/acyl-ACP dehydrogenase [Deltaproteobacteria bacterium]